MVLLDEKFYKGLAADVEDLMTTMYGRGRLAIGAILSLCGMLTMYEVFGMCKTGGGRWRWQFSGCKASLYNT